MSLLGLAGLDFPKIIAQAKDALAADGISLEDHAAQKLSEVLPAILATATADLQQIEAPVLQRLDELIALVKGGFTISITPKT